MSNQPCQHCLRGLTIGKSELCEKCGATGFELTSTNSPTPIETSVVEKVKTEVKKAVKKALKKK